MENSVVSEGLNGVVRRFRECIYTNTMHYRFGVPRYVLRMDRRRWPVSESSGCWAEFLQVSIAGPRAVTFKHISESGFTVNGTIHFTQCYFYPETLEDA